MTASRPVRRALGTQMPGSFEWDHAKAAVNEPIHGVRFDDATSAFYDPFVLTVGDDLHSEHEERRILIGMTDDLRLVTVVYTMRGEVTRIISARRATARERARYVQQLG